MHHRITFARRVPLRPDLAAAVLGPWTSPRIPLPHTSNPHPIPAPSFRGEPMIPKGCTPENGVKVFTIMKTFPLDGDEIRK